MPRGELGEGYFSRLSRSLPAATSPKLYFARAVPQATQARKGSTTKTRPHICSQSVACFPEYKNNEVTFILIYILSSLTEGDSYAQEGDNSPTGKKVDLKVFIKYL